jgi:hypothetical protein
MTECNSNTIFHNCIRQHEGLDGRTPSEAYDIAIVGNDKWRALVEMRPTNYNLGYYESSNLDMR